MAVKSESIVKRKAAQAVKFCVKKERNATLKKVYAVLKKTEVDRSEEEKQFLLNCIDLVKEVRLRIEKQKKLKERLQEVEDPPEVVAAKCLVLAEALSKCRKLVVYTGAGVSTAACIPDYRGSNGIWTLLQQGKDIGLHDLTKAEPTLTHMALTQLHRVGLVKHIVSQNCDGLHLRSGLPKEALSEVHGNMYIEVCRQCQPVKEYLRLFDVTENTARFSHRTGRRCYTCSGSLVDSIVHFGERGTLKWPLNWPGAVAAAANADAILCIGSSLKVLKRYPWLWGMDKIPKKRPKLFIVNLQWTPKDDHAVLKINAKCDFVMKQLMSLLELDIPVYNRLKDPVFPHATPLHPGEKHTTTKPFLVFPEAILNSCSELDSREILSVKYEKLCLVYNYKNKDTDAGLKPEIRSCSSKEEKTVCETSQTIKEENVCCDVKNYQLSCSKYGMKNEITNLCTVLPGSTDVGKWLSNKEPAPHKVILSEEKKELSEKYRFNSAMVGESSLKKKEHHIENFISLEPSLEIIYEGVKLKVEENISVQANVKINNDMAILCDSNSIHQNSFIFNASYELEESENDIKFVHLNDRLSFNDFKDVSKLCSIYDEHPGVIHSSIKFPFEPSILSAVFDNNLKQNPPDNNAALKHERDNFDSGAQMQDFTVSSQTSIKYEKSYECLCCFTWYGASKCLFYPPRNAVFKDSSRAMCECCSEDSDDGDDLSESDKTESKNVSTNPSDAKPISNESDGDKIETKSGSISPVIVKPISNPGWYGKGYRKKIKKKR